MCELRNIDISGPDFTNKLKLILSTEIHYRA